MQSSNSTSSSINPQQIGSMQQRGNIDSAAAQQSMNMVNQVTPFGSLTYNQSGGYSGPGGIWIPQYTATQTLSPGQQGLQNSREVASGGLFGLANDVLPYVSGAYGRFNQRAYNAAPLPDTKAFTDDAYRALTARSDQDIGNYRQATGATLANQGVAAGSDAYNRAYEPVNRQAVDASNQATINSQKLADLFSNREMNLRNFQNQQDLGPLQAYAGLLSTASGGIQQPNFINTPQAQVQAADMTSPFLAQAQLQQKEADQARSSGNAAMGGLFGLAGAGLGGWASGGFGTGGGGGLFGLNSARPGGVGRAGMFGANF